MNKLETAKLICRLAHKGQVDRAGEDYYKHPYKVADLCSRRVDKIVAYLHDIIEDTDINYDDLIECGFSKRVINALTAITHDKSTRYLDYLKIVRKNKIARRVKIADLTHNADISRIKHPTQKDVDRCNKYLEYKHFLEI